MLLALGSAAEAGVARTWVGSSGNDSNTATNCTRAAPCKTFAAAYSVTQSGGEIVALDSVGYGPITITTPLTIIGLEGAFVSVQSNTTGITINSGASVVLRNIQISGAAGSSNTIGIQVNSGKLLLRNSTLSRLTTGLSIAAGRADVIDTEISNNTTGVSTTGTGVDPQTLPITGNTLVRISYGDVINNTTAYFMADPGVGKYTILLRLQGNSAADITTNQTGNTTMVAGSGASCPCTAVGNYSNAVNYNY